PSGFLSDRFGPKRLFVIGVLGTNAMTLLFSQLHSYWPLLANQALSGVFRALVFAPGMLLITSLFPSDRRATAMGLFVAGGFSSNIFLNALGPLAVTRLGWRDVFLIFSLIGFTIVALYWRVGAPGPRR